MAFKISGLSSSSSSLKPSLNRILSTYAVAFVISANWDLFVYSLNRPTKVPLHFNLHHMIGTIVAASRVIKLQKRKECHEQSHDQSSCQNPLHKFCHFFPEVFVLCLYPHLTTEDIVDKRLIKESNLSYYRSIKAI